MSKIGIYVDGSAPINVASPTNPAGWGIVVVKDPVNHEGGTLLMARMGPVVTDTQAGDFIGAEVGSNNTGELSAIYYALDIMDELHEDDEITIYGDSQYAGNMANGSWKPKENKELVTNIRRLWQFQQEQSFIFNWAHVRAHVGHKWNELADRYANEGVNLDSIGTLKFE